MISKIYTLEVKLTFTEGILGTSPKNEEIYRDFIGSKAPDAATVEEEVASLGADEVAEKGMTVFPRDEEGRPFLYDYQIKGFMKDACKMLRNVPGTKSKGLTNYKSKIDGLIFTSPRQIVFENADMTICQRPLRAETMQGPRVALAMSEEIKAGCSATFEINCLNEEYLDAAREWLDYGQMRGIGQWRNSDKGRFTWEEIRVY